MNNTSIREELAAGRAVYTFTSGVSMEPLLYDKKKKNGTHVRICPVKRQLLVGELPIYLRPEGQYVIHRVVGVKQEKTGELYYLTRGDNCINTEQIPEEWVLGVVTEIYRKGKTIRVTDKGYRFYVTVWSLNYPLRRLWCRIRAHRKR